jgi:hypothetical protein
MANANKVERILVSLECLLDTRLGTVGTFDPRGAERLSTDKKYLRREVDVYEGIDMDRFHAAYAARAANGQEVLKHSTLTGMVLFLRSKVIELAEQASISPLFDGVEIEVNSYPFLLGDAVKAELVKCLNVWLTGFAPITIIYADPNSLTPKHCKQRYAMLVDYDWNAWMNLHSDAFNEVRLPEVLFFAPRLYFTGVLPDQKELEEVMRNAPHPFDAMEMQASPIVGLKLIDIAHFSGILRHTQ